MSESTTAMLRHLREQTRDPRPEVRLQAISRLCEQPLERTLRVVLSCLSTLDWVDRRPLLDHLACERPDSRAADVVELLDRRPDQDPPSARDAAEQAARLEAELARVFTKLAAPARALACAERAIRTAPGQLSTARARAYHNLGRALWRLRRFDEARVALRTAADQYDRLEDTLREARVYDTLGSLYLDELELDEAGYCFRRSRCASSSITATCVARLSSTAASASWRWHAASTRTRSSTSTRTAGSRNRSAMRTARR